MKEVLEKESQEAKKEQRRKFFISKLREFLEEHHNEPIDMSRGERYRALALKNLKDIEEAAKSKDEETVASLRRYYEGNLKEAIKFLWKEKMAPKELSEKELEIEFSKLDEKQLEELKRNLETEMMQMPLEERENQIEKRELYENSKFRNNYFANVFTYLETLRSEFSGLTKEVDLEFTALKGDFKKYETGKKGNKIPKELVGRSDELLKKVIETNK